MKFITLILVLFTTLVFAQKEQNYWYFGRYAAMSFESGIAQPKFDNPQNTYGKTASISDPVNGKLLFYTDGVKIWNHKHVVMVGSGQLSSSTNDLIIVPVPNSALLYYMFFIGGGSSLQYVIIDMSKNGGDGEVVEQARTISDNNTAQFAVIRHQYLNAYWIITHEPGNSRFKSHLIGDSSISSSPVISDVGLSMGTYGDMVGSNKGDKLVVTHFYNNDFKAEAFDFDRTCGIISHAVELRKESDWEHAYGIAFSPDDTKLYITYGVQLSQLIQYFGPDYSDNYVIAISQQNFNIMRLGPDGRIYIATHDNGIPGQRINAILNPNNLGTTCNFRETFLKLDEGAGKFRSAQFELPAFASGKKAQSPVKDSIFNYSGKCAGDTFHFSFNTKNVYDSLLWVFDKQNNHVSKTLNPTYTYKKAGKFRVTLTIYRCGNAFPLNDTISVDSVPAFNLPTDTLICSGSTLELKGPFATKYQWSTGETTQTINTNKTGNISLQVSNGLCSASHTIIITNYPDIITELGDEYFICEDDTELVKLDAGEGFISYKWTPTNDTTQWVIVKNTGDYFVKVTDNFGCPGNDETKVKRRCGVLLFFPNAFTPNNDQLNDTYIPRGNDVVSFEMSIYNSWGQLIFTSNDYKKEWDGTINGKPAADGVYVYDVEYTGYKNKRLQHFNAKGNITLLR